MNKRHHTLIFLLTVIALLSLPMLTLAQTSEEEGTESEEPELVCEAFDDSTPDVRVSYYMGEGLAYRATGQLSLALDSFSCIIEQIDGDYTDAYINRALVHTDRRDYEAAITDYSTILELDSQSVPAVNNRGIIYVAQAEYELALADFDTVIDLAPAAPEGYINRGVVYAITDDFDSAITDLEEAIEQAGLQPIVDTLRDPERDTSVELPEYERIHTRAYALLGIVRSAQALSEYQDYLLLNGGGGDSRVQSAAGSLESRFNFDLRLDDGTWLLIASFEEPEEEGDEE